MKCGIAIESFGYTLRDPSVYADPDVFQPERFLNVLGQLDVPVGVETHQMGHTSFGFGKRYMIAK